MEVDDVKQIEPTKRYAGLTVVCRWNPDHVYDGDTAKIIFRETPGGPLLCLPFRFAGYDSEEMKQPKSMNRKERADRKLKASIAKTTLRRLLTGDPTRTTIAKIHGQDKYGRLLGEVYIIRRRSVLKCLDKIEPLLVLGKSVSYQMIQGGYGLPYAGGKKIEHPLGPLERQQPARRKG